MLNSNKPAIWKTAFTTVLELRRALCVWYGKLCCLPVSEVSRGGYRGGGLMLSRGSSLPSPRGMMRGVASGLPLMGRGNPAKAHPAWGGRNSRQMYGRPSFLRGYKLFVFHSILFFCLCIVERCGLLHIQDSRRTKWRNLL